MIDWQQKVYIIFIICIFYQTINLIVRSFFLLSYKPKITNNPPSVSILISARNEAENLINLVPKLMLQTYRDFEVIIALDRCFDNSLMVLKNFEKEFKNLNTIIIDEVPDNYSPKKYALTCCIKAAKHEWLVFTDADCIPNSKNWLNSLGRHMTNENDFVLGFSPYYKMGGFLNQYICYETFITAYQYLSSAIMKSPYMGVGRNMSYRKSLFIKVKGYNKYQSIVGGDDDLFVHYQAHPQRVIALMETDALTYSQSKNNIGEYLTQKKRHLSVSKYYSSKSKLLHTFNTGSLLLLWVSFTILATVNYQLVLISSIIFGSLLIKEILFWRIGRRLGDAYTILLTPVFEIVFVLFQPIATMASLFIKKVKWK